MYRYAIIGFGGLGKKHLANLVLLEKERGDFSLCALCGADEKTVKENIKINLGEVDISTVDFSKCTFYRDYKELIDNEKPDFVISTLPTYLHEEVAVYALEHGVHVFSEKPMALSLESCQKMIDTAKANNRKLMIGHVLRFSPLYNKLKEYINNETFGKARRAEFTRYSQTPLWTWNNWVLDPKFSGGCVIDLHIHDLDLINCFWGKPKSFHAVMTNNKAEQESVFVQYYYDDLLVLANADWSMTQTFPFEAKCLVNFENATVVIRDNKMTVYKDDISFEPDITDFDPFVEEMRAFLKYIIDGEKCKITSPESIMETMRIAFSEIEAAKAWSMGEPVQNCLTDM